MNNCFRCDDTDLLCDLCGESEAPCECDELERSFSPCSECCGDEETAEDIEPVAEIEPVPTH